MGFTLLNAALCGSASTLQPSPSLSMPSPLFVSLHSCPCLLCSSPCWRRSVWRDRPAEPKTPWPVTLPDFIQQAHKLSSAPPCTSCYANWAVFGAQEIKPTTSQIHTAGATDLLNVVLVLLLKKGVFLFPSCGLYPIFLSLALPPAVLQPSQSSRKY